MGRPTNDKYFGDPADPGMQIRATVRFPGEASAQDAYIVRQRSNRKYLFKSVDEAHETVAMLMDKPEAELEENEAVIIVSTTNGGNEVQAEATYDVLTNEISAVDVTVAGDGYADGVFDVDITGGVDGEATIRFTVTNNTVDSGEVLSQSGDFGADSSGNTIDMPAPEGFAGTENVRIINNRVVKTFSNNIYSWIGEDSPARKLGGLDSV